MTSRKATSAEVPLLMLPGTLCDGRVFAPMLDELSRHGGLGTIDGPMTGAASAGALAEAILHDAPSRFIPVGFSLGAIVALELAVRAPERIAAMVLIAANARAVPAADWPMRRANAAIEPGELVGQVLWPRSVGPARLGDDALRATIVAMARGHTPAELVAQTEVALTRSDKRTRLASLVMPTLVLGGEHDAIAPPALQREIADAMPHARLDMIPDAGHFVPLEQPLRCAAAIAAWRAALPFPEPHTTSMEAL